MTEACSQVFMLVGQGFALDGGAEQTRVACGLPSVAGYADQRRRSPPAR